LFVRFFVRFVRFEGVNGLMKEGREGMMKRWVYIALFVAEWVQMYHV